MFLTQEKLEARIGQLEPLRYVDMQPVTPLAAMDGGTSGDGEKPHIHAPDIVEGLTLTLGDEFTGRDRYMWARKVFSLPPHREDCQVVGLFDFGDTGGGHNSGFESLLYVDREAYQGVDTFHGDVVLEPFAGREAELTFLLWTGLEGGGARKEFRHRVRKAHIGYLHVPTDELYWLGRAIVETTALLPDTALEKHDLMAALDGALRHLNWDRDKLHATVVSALKDLKNALDAMEKHAGVTVSVVGHTHIDVAWLWRFVHTREKAARSFSTVLRLMEEFPEYIFLQSQPQLYAYIKNDCPALYDRIKERIKEGRWEPGGGMWVEPDCNLPSGESLTRQLVHGIRFFREEFGTECTYLWLPDVFGYSWALPQLLKLCGISTFMTTKISWNQYNAMPHDLFWWRGLDGSEVLAYFITTPDENRPMDAQFSTYNGKLAPRAVLGSWQKFRDKDISRETLISYGYGDGGGGVNRDMLKLRRAMDKLPGLPHVKPTRADDFFARTHERVQSTGQYVHTWDGELYLEYHRGTYTSQGRTKKMNRQMENTLLGCEWLSSICWLRGGAYPQETLYGGWQTVLLHQFHDVIPGSSIREVYEDQEKAFSALNADLTTLTRHALTDLTQPAEHRFTLYHTGSFPRREPVFVPVDAEGTFTDGEGNTLPAQRTKGGWLVTAELAPFAFHTVTFCPGTAPQAPSAFTVDLAAGTLETPLYRITWNQNGHLTGLFDKANSRKVLAGPGNVLEIYEDKPLQYDNWDIDIFHTQKREVFICSAPPALLESGTERCVVRFCFTYNNSSVTVDMVTYRTCPRIDFQVTADWREADRVLKAAFPVDVRSTKATYDIQYGHAERPTHWNTSWDWARFEVVGHKWADLSESDYGVSLLNDCKYGYSVKDNVLRLTLLKSSKYPDTECDMGEHAFTYALLPHAGSVTEGPTIEESVNLNLPAAVVAGALSEPRRLIRTDARSVIVDAVKKADREDCLIVRVHECRGARGRVSLTSDFGLCAYTPCNLLEEDLGPKVEGDRIETVLKPFEIRTYKLWFR